MLLMPRRFRPRAEHYSVATLIMSIKTGRAIIMTYDPGRDPQNPLDVNPKPREFRDPTPRAGSGMSAGLWVGILAVLAAATFFMFSTGRDDNVATFERPGTNSPATTGSGEAAPAPANRNLDTANPPTTTAPAPKQ